MEKLAYECNPSRKPIVLIVDDMPSNIEVLAQLLHQSYEIKVASNGARALEIMKSSTQPDIILTDVMMPGMDGYELCRNLKGNPFTMKVPVIFVTAKDEITDQQYGFDIGASDYITRPINGPLVRARVKVHIKLKMQSDFLEHIAMFDALTSIPNRRSLDVHLHRELGRAVRHKETIAVIMIDIDHFKSFNDEYGHGIGDSCLAFVARTLLEALHRPEDFIGRFGGEEFVVLLSPCSPDAAFHVADRMRQAVSSAPFSVSENKTKVVTVSLGVMCRPVDATDSIESIIAEADAALYTAKQEGRNRVQMA